MNFFEDVITPFLEPRIKKTSLKAVKAYVETVNGARKTAVMAYETSLMAAILVTGVILMVIAVIGLTPIDPRIALVGMFILGAIMATASFLITRKGLSEETWLQLGKVQEMIDAAVKPWETPYSIPNPAKILKGDEADQNFQENRKLKTSRANQTPAPSAHDAVDAHVPAGAHASMTTPDVALTTRAMDTTSTLTRERDLS